MEKKEYGSWTVEGGCWEKQRREGERVIHLRLHRTCLEKGVVNMKILSSRR